MELEKILQNVESRLVRVGHAFWKPDPLAELREEAQRISDELRKRHERHDRAKAESRTLERRVSDNQNTAHVLTASIETCLGCSAGDQAWQFAMQLDRVRQELATDQARLPQLEQVCWSLKFQIRQMERQLALVHEKLYPA